MSLIVISVFALLFDLSAQAGGSQIISQQSPIDYRVVVPCTKDAEVVRLSGTLHVTFRAMPDANGGYHVTSHANWQRVTGVNEATGEIYHFIGGGNGSSNSNGELSFTSNMITTGAAVSSGDGIIFYVHNIYHVTMNAQGELSAQFMHQTADCKNETEVTQ
jgi:hypothetical protein